MHSDTSNGLRVMTSISNDKAPDDKAPDDKAPDDQDRAASEAAHWLVALDEDPDDEALSARFQAWLAADPNHAEIWASISDVYDMIGQTRPARTDDRKPRHRTAPGRKWILPGIAAIATCLAIALPSALVHMQADYVTATAEAQRIDMEDGSTVHLAPESAVTLTDNARSARLIKGEAFFDVIPDAKPFIVTADKVTATVLGTAFNMRMGDNGIVITLREGRVRVDHAALSEHLAAGDWLRIGRDGSVQRGTAPPDEAGAWRYGQIVARDRPLVDIIDDLRRYHEGVIFLTDTDFGNQPVSGVYNLANPITALRALAQAHGGTAWQISPWLSIVRGQ